MDKLVPRGFSSNVIKRVLYLLFFLDSQLQYVEKKSHFVLNRQLRNWRSPGSLDFWFSARNLKNNNSEIEIERKRDHLVINLNNKIQVTIFSLEIVTLPDVPAYLGLECFGYQV